MSETDLPGLLAAEGLYPKSYDPGRSAKMRCPRCEGGKSREQCLSLTINANGDGATWLCHRGNCGWKGGARLQDEPRRRYVAPKGAPPIDKPPEHLPTQQSKPAEMYQFFSNREISAETVDAFGIYVTKRWFPADLGEQPAIVFPYLFRASVVNRKYRPPQKSPQMQEKNALPTLFNIDAIATPDVVCWVEGEPDVMAMHEAGYPQTVTLPNGAGGELKDEDDPRRDEDKRFRPLSTHADMLEKVGKFILAGDADAPGMALREELARRLGRHRCWLVTWPEGCKDACDALMAGGVECVRQAIEAATPYPIEGLQSLPHAALVGLRHSAPPPRLTTGTRATDVAFRFPGEGRLIVITGLPGSGKSTWLKFVMIHLMGEVGRRFLLFSPEMQPWEQFMALCAETWAGSPFWPTRTMDGMSDAEITAAEDWLRPRLQMLVSDAETDPPTLDWIIERARASVLRNGTTDIGIDPWNEVEHQRSGMTLDEYTGRSLQRLRAFAFRHGINVWIVAHPVKMVAAKPGGKIAAPDMYDINGGGNWYNKTDLGLCVHLEDGITEILVRKARFMRWGKRNNSAKLVYDSATQRFSASELEFQPTSFGNQVED